MRLFISYAHVDKPNVKDWIVDKLEAGGHDVWFDDKLIGGQAWKRQLSDQIQRSDGLVYCMTPEAIASEWCQWELAEASRYGKPVVPVLMQARTPIPEAVAHLQYVDFSNGPTPDAVARLLGGLQQLAQVPSAPTNPTGLPPQAMKDNKFNINRLIGGAAGIILFFVAIFGVLPDQTRDSFFVSVGVLSPTDTPTATSTASSTPTATATGTATPTSASSESQVQSNESSMSSTPLLPTNTPAAVTQYPCEAQIRAPSGSSATVINEVRLRPSSDSRLSVSPANPLSVGLTISVVDKDEMNTSEDWYQIRDINGNYLGWIQGRHLILSNSCPD